MRAGTCRPPACCHAPVGAHRSTMSLRGHRQPTAGPREVSPAVRRGTEGCTEQHPASRTGKELSAAGPGLCPAGVWGHGAFPLGVRWGGGDGERQPSAGKGGRKRSRTREVAKWRALIYRRSLCSFPEIERRPSDPALGARYGAGLGCAASRPAHPVPARGGTKTPPPPERRKRQKERGGTRNPRTRENNGTSCKQINETPSKSDQIARHSFPINSQLYNFQVLGKAAVLSFINPCWGEGGGESVEVDEISNHQPLCRFMIA